MMNVLIHLTGWIISQCKVKVTQSCPTLCNPMDYTAHGILQTRILKWVALPLCRRSSQPRDQTQVSRIAGGFFASWATREAQEYWNGEPNSSPVDLPDPGIEPGSPALQANSYQRSYHERPSQCIHVSQHQVVHFKYFIILFVNYTSVKLGNDSSG